MKRKRRKIFNTIDLKLTFAAVEDFWSDIPVNISSFVGVGRRVDFMVSPENFEHVSGYLSCSGVPFSVASEDIQKLIDDENYNDEDEEGKKRLNPLYPKP